VQRRAARAEHRRAGVDADDAAAGPDFLEQFGDVKPGPAADVDDVLPGCDAERGAGEPAPAHHVAGLVHRVEPGREPFVEHHLAHAARE